MPITDAHRDHQVHLAFLDKMELQVFLDQLVHQVCQEICQQLTTTSKVIAAHARTGHQDHQAQLANLVDREAADHPDLQETVVRTETLDHQDLLAHQEKQQHQENRDHLAHRAHLDHKAAKENQDHVDLRDHQDHPDHQDRLDIQETRDTKDHRVHKDLLAKPVRTVNADHLDKVEHLVDRAKMLPTVRAHDGVLRYHCTNPRKHHSTCPWTSNIDHIILVLHCFILQHSN